MKHIFFLFASFAFIGVYAVILPLPAVAANSATGTTGASNGNFASSDVPNILQDYTTDNGLWEMAKKVFGPLLNIWGPMNEKASQWWKSHTSGSIKKWADQRIGDIKTGFEEEKQELQQDFSKNSFQFLRTIWQKIRDKF
ncbi:MAG: hypothetical protein M1127_02590 [Patescibacteria group bacterium]|nr:hypothetical protein [Patescibacteria group bacterium]